MSAQTNFSYMLQDILPLHCQRYLKWKNWKLEKAIDDYANIWVTSTDQFENIRILLPLDTEFNDYKLRMAEFIDTLRVAENRSHESIIADLKGLCTDKLRITLSNTKGDGVNFASAAKVMDRSLDMLAAAANSLIEPKPHYRTRPRQVQQYIESLELGHTEHGSFVFKIYSPVAPALMTIASSDVYEEEEPPFARKVMCQLAELLKNSVAAATRGEQQNFKDAVKQGISSNFCEALGDVVANSDSSEVSFDFSWSLARPYPAREFNRIVIRRDVAEILKEAGSFLKTNIPEESVEVIGYVVGLDRDQPNADGEIKIVDISDGQNRNIYLKLAQDQYQEAIKAHTKGNKVKVIGDIERKYNRSWMTHIIKFSLIE